MNERQASVHAARMGLSTWVIQAIASGEECTTAAAYCVGFAELGLGVGEGDTWQGALEQAARVVFSV